MAAGRYKGKSIVWKPQPKQAAFMQRSEGEALYGGAAGGGKSDALVIEALRQVDVPHYCGLIVRKTYPQLSELIDKTMQYYRPAFPKARYNASSHVWTFPSGAKIYFGSMFRTQDKYNYQGKAFDFIGVDELTHFTWEEYSYLMSRNRPTGPGTVVYMRATANPGGIGHGWVKARFITPTPPGTRMVQLVDVKKPDGSVAKLRRTRVFIPSTVFDNKKLLENDPGYLGTLASLPEAEKQALLYGDWDSFSGQVFTEWCNDPAHYEDQRWTHVIKPFRIPAHWHIWRGYDFGYSKPFSVGWYAADEEGRPMFQVFDTCRHFIRTIPNLVYDESNVEDIDTTQEDHVYDECRYVLMENPISPRQVRKEVVLRDDPLDMDVHRSPIRVMRVWTTCGRQKKTPLLLKATARRRGCGSGCTREKIP